MSETDELKRALRSKEKEWEAMVRIAHDFFLNWRRAVAELHGERAARAAELRAWERVAEGTASAHRARGAAPQDIEALAASIARVSGVMRETAHVERDGADRLVVHTACPWPASYRAYGAGATCQAGCDHWFRESARGVSPAIRVVTESAIPAGDAVCTRRFSILAQEPQR